MAEVLLARATGIEGFERHVVIKRIRDGQAKDATFVQMFLQEARLAAQLHHHNIVQVHDIGQERGEYFFAMEYVHGEDLRLLLTRLAKERGKVPIEHVVTIISSAAVALHHAHEQRGPDRKPLGIVHRDVTPANIIVGYDGNVKVVDFGIAKAAVRSSETQVGMLKGKASYMAPEQCTGETVDRRSDVFALGIVLYELACTRRLFKADNDFLTMSAIVKGEIPRPTQHRPDMPKALEDILLKALAAKREDRYQTADEMREALEQFAATAGLRMSTSALGAYMKQVFGERPEPWLVDDDDEPEMSLTVDFDGSASGIAAPPPESLESLAIPQMVEAMKSSPIMKARKKAITDAPPSKQLMSTVPTVVAAGKAVRAPVGLAKEPSEAVRIPERLGAPEPSKPVLRPVVAAPAPRRKPITIQIPTSSQTAGVPAKSTTPPPGQPVAAPVDEIDTGWSAGVAKPAEAMAPAAAAATAAPAQLPPAKLAGVTPRADATPAKLGIPSVTGKRATPPSAFLGLSARAPSAPAPAPPAGPSPIASVMAAASLTPRSPDAEPTSANTVLAELAATAPTGATAMPSADAEPAGAHAPIDAAGALDTAEPSPVTPAPSEPIALPPAPAVPRPGEVPVMPLAAAAEDPGGARAFDRGGMVMAGGGVHASSDIAAIARGEAALRTPARQPSSVPDEWPDASSAVGSPLRSRLLERVKAMPRRIAAGAAAVIVLVVAVVHCSGGSKSATSAHPAGAPVAAPVPADKATPGETPSPAETPTAVETDTTAPTPSPAAAAAAVPTQPTTAPARPAPPPARPTAHPSTRPAATATKPAITTTAPKPATRPPLKAATATRPAPTATKTVAKPTTKATTSPATKTPTKPAGKATKPAPKWDPNALFPKK